MEVLASILSSAVVKTGSLLCGSIYPGLKNTIRFRSNLDALEKDMGGLIELRNNVNQELEVAEIDGKLLRTTQVKEWLTDVEGIELKVNSLQAGITANNENFCGSFLKCTHRYRRGRQVAKMLNEVERLLEACNFPAGMLAVSHQVEAVKYIPGPSIEDQTTTSNTLTKTMNMLSEDGVRSIGIWGMGGVGKTTLIKNLNNKLKSTSLIQPFGTVIWVTVSKELDLKRVQTQIAERLILQVSLEESHEGLACRLYERLMKEKKFLLILDDVWETIDLDSLGVPQPEIHRGSKIILTSRSLAVCEGMKADVKIKVEVLNDEEAWLLFTKNTGSVASSEHIRPFAKAVARECNGLPLAIIIVGTAMRGKAMVELWKNALNELQHSNPYIAGIENKVYKPLKWSYDSLNVSAKPCFLYCSMFPEDYSIQVSELVQCWMAEGLIDEELNYEDSLNRGITVVENLKDLCLLEPGIEEGTVKMHDVVRDVAIWIAFSLEDGCKSLVKSGIGLTQISKSEMLKPCKRISFMNNKIKTLPDCMIQCPYTSTLLLQGNVLLDKVPESFLLGLQALRVLNMSETHIRLLPQSLTQLGELRALVLRKCLFIVDLPPLGGLRKLQMLDLCGTLITKLPKGMEELSNLRQLHLSNTRCLKTIEAGVISSLSSLEVLDMAKSAYKWGVKGDVEKGQTMFEELGHLERLAVVCICLKSTPYLGREDLIWIERWKSFEIMVRTLGSVMYSTKCDERSMSLTNFSENRIRWLLINASNLELRSCMQIGSMFEDLVRDCEGFAGLKSLRIQNCDIIEPDSRCAARLDLPPNLEQLFLDSISYVQCVGPLASQPGPGFSRLRVLEVRSCPELKYLIPNNLISPLINLEEIKVSECHMLEKLIEYSSSGQNVAPDYVVQLRFSRLRVINVSDCRQLKYLIHHDQISCLISLEEIKVSGCSSLGNLFEYKSKKNVAPHPVVPKLQILEVFDCIQLRRLPLTTRNANTLKVIRGNKWWWNQLVWDDDDIKLTLLPLFKPNECNARGALVL